MIFINIELAPEAYTGTQLQQILTWFTGLFPPNPRGGQEVQHDGQIHDGQVTVRPRPYEVLPLTATWQPQFTQQPQWVMNDGDRLRVGMVVGALAQQQVDVMIGTAVDGLEHVAQVDQALLRAGGVDLAAHVSRAIQHRSQRLWPGQAQATGSGNLPAQRLVLVTPPNKNVTGQWDPRLLFDTYVAALLEANRLGGGSVALELLGVGPPGWTVTQSLQQAFAALMRLSRWLPKIRTVVFVVPDADQAASVSELFGAATLMSGTGIDLVEDDLPDGPQSRMCWGRKCAVQVDENLTEFAQAQEAYDRIRNGKGAEAAKIAENVKAVWERVKADLPEGALQITEPQVLAGVAAPVR